MTKSFCLHSLLKCVDSFSDWVDTESIHKATPDNPYKFFSQHLKQIKILDAYYKENIFDELGLKAIVSENSQEIENFFKSNGFNISIKELKENEVGFGSLFDLFLEWVYPYNSAIINNKYQGFYASGQNVSYYHSDILDSYGASIKSKNNHEIFFLPIRNNLLLKDLDSLDFFDLVNIIDENLLKKNSSYFSKVEIPYVSFINNSNLDFMLDFNLSKTDWGYAVVEAQQQNKIDLNNVGLRVASATYLGVSGFSGCVRETNILTIDNHFLMWVKSPNLKLPYFVSFVDFDSWKLL